MIWVYDSQNILTLFVLKFFVLINAGKKSVFISCGHLQKGNILIAVTQ